MTDVLLPAGAVEAFARGDAIELAKLLQLRPWQVNPIDAVGPCPWPAHTEGARSWPMAVHVRRALERAAASRVKG
jgi:hypothetical protein